ncbi:MAG: hypothetical protein NW218_00755 [Saprospiraceae bacterium]|nr:hypothetical protein [Saprospiraceae bacterium]
MPQNRNCLQCQKPVKGRSDKKFCTPACKSAFHNNISNIKLELFKETERVLRKNYTILDQYFNLGDKKVTIEADELDKGGFKWEYLTRVFHNNKGVQYAILYDIAWTKSENGRIDLLKK